VKYISSHGNPLFKSLARLRDSPRERRAERVALLDGAHLVATYLERTGRPRLVAISAAAADAPEIRALFEAVQASESIILTDGLFGELSPVTTPAGILAVVDIPSAQPVPRDAECCLLLENIQDPGNVGSILRSAAAAAVRHVLLSRGCADIWSPRVLRAAMGAHFALNMRERENLTAFARDYPGQVVATGARAARSIFEVDLTGPTAFVVGNEGAGITEALVAEADFLAVVPMSAGVESINVGAAAAVCLFERVRQLKANAER
jgi:RNA methyltransferase, TrmH family